VNRLSAVLGTFTIITASALACNGSDLVLPADGTPAQLTITRGDGQPGSPGTPLPDSLEVQVQDERGEPLPGTTVTFTVGSEAPGAQVSPEAPKTRSDGTARAAWVLGGTSGTQTVVAQVDRGSADPLTVTFNASVGPAPARVIASAGGDEQSAPARSQLENPLVVLVTDGFGNPVAGVSVDWNAENGSVNPGSSVTGDDGKASTMWTLGSSTGPQSATATSVDLEGSPVTFTATALPGSPNTLELVSGNNQSAAAGAELQDPLVVRLLDDAGNGVPNRAVSWVVATGGGSVNSVTSNTDENGRASTRWTLGAQGNNTLNAVVSGVGVVGFTANATGGGGGGGGGGDPVPTRLDFRVQPSDTEEGGTISPDVQVQVLDQFDNLVTDQDFSITLELLDKKDEVRADGTNSTQSGVATFTIRIDRRGDYRLRASTDGLPSVESDRFKVRKD
jgi:hypothetical protein